MKNGGKTSKAAKSGKNGGKTVKQQKTEKKAKIILGAASKFLLALPRVLHCLLFMVFPFFI